MNVQLILDSDIGITRGWQSSEDISDLNDALHKIDYANSLVKPIVDNWYNNNIASNPMYLSLIRDFKLVILYLFYYYNLWISLCIFSVISYNLHY